MKPAPNQQHHHFHPVERVHTSFIIVYRQRQRCALEPDLYLSGANEQTDTMMTEKLSNCPLKDDRKGVVNIKQDCNKKDIWPCGS